MPFSQIISMVLFLFGAELSALGETSRQKLERWTVFRLTEICISSSEGEDGPREIALDRCHRAD